MACTGKTPTPVDPEVQKKVLKGYKRARPRSPAVQPTISNRSWKGQGENRNPRKDDFDLLIYALYRPPESSS